MGSSVPSLSQDALDSRDVSKHKVGLGVPKGTQRNWDVAGCVSLTCQKMGLPWRAVTRQQTDPRDWRGGRGVSPWVDKLAEAWVPGEVFLEDSTMLLALELSVGTPEMSSQLH